MDGRLFLMVTGMILLVALVFIIPYLLGNARRGRSSWAQDRKTASPGSTSIVYNLQTGAMFIAYSLLFFARPLGKGLTVLKVTGLATAAWCGIAGVVLLLAGGRTLLFSRALRRSGTPGEAAAGPETLQPRVAMFLVLSAALSMVAQNGLMLGYMVLETGRLQLLEKGTVIERRTAATELGGEFWLVDSTPSLVAALGDADPEVRRLAARALSSRDSLSTEAAAALEAALKDMEPGPAGAAAAGGSP